MGNIPPLPTDWPSLPAMVSKLRPAPTGVPSAVRLPYPMVDNGTLQAGEYGGWLGVKHDPIVMRPAGGEPWGGVSRTLGSEVLNLAEGDFDRVASRKDLLSSLEKPFKRQADFESFNTPRPGERNSPRFRRAKRLRPRQGDPKIRATYGNHLGGQSMLLARRLTEAGVPHRSGLLRRRRSQRRPRRHVGTHADNFNRLKNRLLPVSIAPHPRCSKTFPIAAHSTKRWSRS